MKGNSVVEKKKDYDLFFWPWTASKAKNQPLLMTVDKASIMMN